MQSILEKAIRIGQLREIDLHSALFLNDLAEQPSSELLLATALASRAVGDGHICLPLGIIAGQSVFGSEAFCRAPEITAWRRQLSDSGVVGLPGENKPLLMDGADRLYLARFFKCERIIADDLLRRSRKTVPVDFDKAAPLISRLFPNSKNENWQKMAAAVAVLKKFIVISGGPGTGKTFTVARILALLQSLTEDEELQISLVAPTGKAAVRLQESIMVAREAIDDDLAAKVPVETKTLHRLLGYMPEEGTFRYNTRNQLHLDLLVIDEASMIDVPLMAGLVEALPEKTRIILLGDKDQLTSVEAGSLFGDICPGRMTGWSAEFCPKIEQLAGWAPDPVCSKNTFGDCICILQTSHRFQENKGIAMLADAVNRGDADRLTNMYEQNFEDLDFELMQGNVHQILEQYLVKGFELCFKCSEPGEVLVALSRFRILTAVREGPNGVTGVNQLAEKVLRKRGLIRTGDRWYKGRPLIIRKNHYGLHLFNGDTGIVWPDIKGRLWAWFNRSDGTLHQVPLSRLPEHDTAYAITVHQSQGSEFSSVLFLLPDADSKVLCRELIYTAITRAREKLIVTGEKNLLETGVRRNVTRYSGLKEKLRKVEESC